MALGETVVVTRRGKPVAQLVKYGSDTPIDDSHAAWDRLTTTLESGFSLGGDTYVRDELHER